MIGCTVSTQGGLIKGVDRAASMGCQCTQVYITRSRTWDVKPTEKDYLCLAEYAKNRRVHLIAHVPLIVNLASKCDAIRTKSIYRLQQEILRAGQYGIHILVLHPGSTLDNDPDKGIAYVAEAISNLSDLCKEHNVVLALETMSGQGTQIGSHFEELAHIIDSLKDNSHVAVCIDTCHLYAAGYQIDSLSHLSDLLDQFNKLIGMEKLRAIHLNNTKMRCGSKIDRHSSIFDGNIPLEVFESLVCDKSFSEIPMVIEPPARDQTGAQQVRYLMNLRQGECRDEC